MSWQEATEKLLNPFGSFSEKSVMLTDLVGRREEIMSDLSDAAAAGDVERLFVEGTELRRVASGVKAVQRQVTEDLLPGAASDVPAVLASLAGKLPAAATDLVAGKAPGPLSLEGLAALPARLSDEAANVVSRMPRGLETPRFTVVFQGDGFEVRDYEAFAIAATGMGPRAESASGRYEGGTFDELGGVAEVDAESGNQAPAPDDTFFGKQPRGDATGSESVSESGSVEATDALAAGDAFNALAGYIFGANDAGESMAMTTPVITSYQGRTPLRMSFVLPGSTAGGGGRAASAETSCAAVEAAASGAPRPSASRVVVSAKMSGRVAVKEFGGFATAGEVQRQVADLKAALFRSGMAPAESGGKTCFQVYQYNPPTTLPFLRKNEIAIRLKGADDDSGALAPQAEASAGATSSGTAAGAPDGAADLEPIGFECETEDECGVPSD